MARLALFPAWILCIQIVVYANCLAVDKVYQVEDQDFSHLIMNTDTGDIVVGGKNIVFQFDPDLNLKHNVSTGPHPDNSECYADSAIQEDLLCATFGGSKVEKVPTDNYNQIIVVDHMNKKTITCGTLFQGQCSVHNLDDISQFELTALTTSHSIASNKHDLPNVAFIGPGMVQDGSTKTIGNVIYVGTSQKFDTRNGNHLFLASRNLNEFSLAYGSLTDDPSIVDPAANPVDRTINFVSHLTIDGFSYLFMTDGKAGGEMHSKVARICHNSMDLSKSYVDMYISCERDSKIYSKLTSVLQINDNNILGSFVDPDTPSSALCVFSMSDIGANFTWNLQSCYSGTITREGLFDGDECQKFDTYTPEGIEQLVDYCGEDAFFEKYLVPLSSPPTTKPTSQPIFESNDEFTGLATMKVNGQHIVFIGTSGGHLMKIHITSDLRRANEISSTEMFEDAVKQDMVVTQNPEDVNDTFLYAMSSTEVKKLRVEKCEQYTTCDTCTGAKDPHCGWCSLEASCTTKEECIGDQERDDIWLDFQQTECIALTSVTPTQVPINRDTRINLNFQRLPEQGSDENYKCVFTASVTAESPIEIISAPGETTSARCTVPSTFKPDLGDSDHVVFRLDVLSTGVGVPFLQQEGMILYDCAIQDTCSECASSEFGCKWCVHDNHCRPEVAACEQVGSVVVQNGNGDGCPSVKPPSNNIYISIGVLSTIDIAGQNLPSPKDGQMGYKCILNISGTMKTVPATNSNSNVVCEETSYSYNQKEPETKVSVQVTFDEYPVMSETDIYVWLYKCDVLATDCSTCIGLDEAKYQCAYCDRSIDTCAPRALCEQTENSCPQGNIESISPISGPIEGETWMTIRGTDLSNINLKIEVAGIECAEIQQNSSTIVLCKTRAIDNPTGKTGKVVITKGLGDNKETVESDDIFAYKNPRIVSFTPEFGPKSGGTMVDILGQQLDVDVKITININSQSTCAIHNVTHDRIVCITDPLPPENTIESASPGAITFDTTDRPIGTKVFQYRLDPTVSDVFPTQFYESGGRVVTISGTNLDVVQHPQLLFVYEDEKYYHSCNDSSKTQLKCLSPNMKDTVARRRRQTNEGDGSEGAYIGLIMDGVLSVRDLSNITDPIVVYEDPVFKPFGDVLKSYKPPDPLVIEGNNLNKATSKGEIKVKIDQEDCVIYQLTEENLLCNPPEERPKKDENKYSVKVIVGNQQVEIGDITYDTGNGPDDILIIGVAVAGGILIMVIIVITIVYKRKSTEAERQYKKLQMQLDTLESNVRNECKQAFAELQTEVSDFTSDINSIGIPFWDYKTYTFKVLFPGLQDHQVLHTSDEYHTNKFGGYDQGLHMFNQLLNSKQFLVIFIRTLENQKAFSIRDKAQVASLLMIALQDKMEYATEILKALLDELIDRSVEKKHPKLMLRRMESVVEKMLTNWLSICMYGYLKKQAGKSLFLLYKAVKHQTEKGPVDAITSESRYSLSEDRLLREKIDAKTLNINLVIDDNREPVSCKMLDCDTITQAKEKALDAIYMNTPLARRPSVHDVDLVILATFSKWRTGRTGHLPLQDEDVTTEVVHGWKKINTLKHYHVPDGATMAIVPKREKNDGVRNVHGMVEITSTLSSVTPIMTMEEGAKVWHLVKHDDTVYVSRTQKVISEIFLTRLLATKGTLQQYIDDLFNTILRVDQTLPPAIKYLFDFLDSAAKRHNISDPEVVHTWKSNSLPLRFWVNIIKNPEFVMDIRKSHIVDSCLSVIAQTFMDSCSTSEHRLGKDSPSNKLLFAKDIPRYRSWVTKYYQGIQQRSSVSDQEMSRIMTDLSLCHIANFNVSVALKELYRYANTYSFELLENLDSDASSRRLHLANKFEEVMASIEGPNMY